MRSIRLTRVAAPIGTASPRNPAQINTDLLIARVLDEFCTQIVASGFLDRLQLNHQSLRTVLDIHVILHRPKGMERCNECL
jgi:hypothetical protein